jgi:hypothetical protein
MTTLTMEEPSLVTDYQPEDDLEELWLELARDLIDHARITREWLVREAREFEAGHSPGTQPPPRDDMRHPPPTRFVSSAPRWGSMPVR